MGDHFDCPSFRAGWLESQPVSLPTYLRCALLVLGAQIAQDVEWREAVDC